MPIIQGEWYDENEVPFMKDCCVHDDPHGGPRCSLRPHDTKRRRRPGDFKVQAEFGHVARLWSTALEPIDRYAWSWLDKSYKNRRLEAGDPCGNLAFMNHNLPLRHAGRAMHLVAADMDNYAYDKLELLEVDTDFDKLRVRFTYYQFPPQRDNGTLHLHQVLPRAVKTDQAWRYAYWCESHDCRTTKFHPDKEVDEFWISLVYHADPGDTVQIYHRFSQITGKAPPDPYMFGITQTYPWETTWIVA